MYVKDENQIFRTSLKKFLEKEAYPYYDEWEAERIIPRDFWRKMGSNGFLSPHLNEEYGAEKEMTKRVASQCMQLFGGYGYMEEYEIARRYRDAPVSAIYAGTNEIMKLIIAKKMAL